jgi:hypothetical protein
MLNDNDIKRISAEEQLRHEIRQQLAAAAAPPKTAGPASASPAPHGFGKKLMDFLNSSVGMWLLSSVVLTGGAALIQQVQHSYQIKEQNHQQLVSHLFEIQNRLDNMEYLLRRAQTVGDAKKALNGLFKSLFPLSPELQNRSLSSLYFAVYNLIPGDRQQKAQEAIEFVRQLEDSEYALQARPDSQALTDADRAQFDKLIKACKAIHLAVDIKRIH